MRAFVLTAVLACSSLAAPSALAHTGDEHTASQMKTVNTMCPVGKEPIVESAGTIEYDGNTIGICCPKCGEQFLAWDKERKDMFVTLAIDHKEPGTDNNAEPKPAQANADSPAIPYILATCPISGEPLGSMGESISKVYDGREVSFCCSMCIPKFEADKTAYFKQIDEQIITDQLPYYPIQTCVISGEPLVEEGENISKNIVFNNRLVRLCCNMCVRKFKADPAGYLTQLDKQTADAQRDDYPLTTCIVAGGALGSMGEPSEIVVAGRLFRFCCANCEPKVKADPAKYIKLLDDARVAKGN